MNGDSINSACMIYIVGIMERVMIILATLSECRHRVASVNNVGCAWLRLV